MMNQLTELAGNPTIHRQLVGAPLNHAYIISGQKGSGRHTLAHWLSQKYVCTAPEEMRPCGECIHCKKAASNIHPDIITVPLMIEKNKKINPARARAYQADAFIFPNEAARKVYIFDQAGEYSEIVQNILLKLVEEGPRYGAFLLITEHTSQLIETLQSRCEKLSLLPVPYQEIMDYLIVKFPSRDRTELETAAHHSGGLIGRAIQKLNSSKRTSGLAMDLAVDFCSALSRKSELDMAAFMLRNQKRKREQLGSAFEQIRSMISAALLAKSKSQPCEDEFYAQLTSLPEDCLLNLNLIMLEAYNLLQANTNPGNVLAWLSINCIEAISE